MPRAAGAGSVEPVRQLARRDPFAVDAAIAAVLAVASLVQVLLVLPIGSPAAGALVALWSTVPVAWRRRRPAEAAIVGSTAWLIPTDGYLLLGYVAVFLLFGAVGAHVARRDVVVLTTLAGVALAVAAAAMHGEVVGEYAGGVLAVVAPVAVGRFLRRERRRSEQLAELARHLEHERERSTHAAVVEERARIARELHDVVSHGLSAIAVQSDAAEAALARDPGLATQPLRTIRASAREALHEMRGLLGVLRDGDTGNGTGPLPGLADAPALVERARATGLRIDFAFVPPPRPLPPGVDLSAYRILQEALTNARRHAGPTDVDASVAWDGRQVRIVVRDAGGPGGAAAADGAGRGLIGMRERTRLHGGTLTAAPLAEGGFEVIATLDASAPA
jgi:signal transduction histidine kinase